MKYISDEELNEMEQGGKFYWGNRDMTPFVKGGHSIPLQPTDVLQCLRCNAHFMPGECGNCGHTKFDAYPASGGFGIFCNACEKGFSTWPCPKCGTDNPVSKTLFRLFKKGGCFIATAASGSPDDLDVRSLCHFRDNYLLHSRAGRAFVSFYYSVSPFLAKFVAQSSTLRSIMRVLLIGPAASLYRIVVHESSTSKD